MGGNVPQKPMRAGLAAICLFLPILAACASPSADAGLCTPAQVTSMETLQDALTTDGTLRHGRAYRRDDGAVFVSAELLPAGEDVDHDGDILTWFAVDLALGDFASVDAHAREDSLWPPTSFSVDEEGAIASRGCVLTMRGDPLPVCEEEFEQFC